MSDIIILNEPKFNTEKVQETIVLISQETKKVKYEKRDQENSPSIEQIADFTSWEFKIYQKDKTDTEWDSMYAALKALETGLPVDFYPDTVDNSSVVYKSYMFFNKDVINDDGTEFIWCKVIRFYSNGNEV